MSPGWVPISTRRSPSAIRWTMSTAAVGSPPISAFRPRTRLQIRKPPTSTPTAAHAPSTAGSGAPPWAAQ